MRVSLIAGLMMLFVAATAQASPHKSCEFSTVTNKTDRATVHALYGKPDRVQGDPLSIDVYNTTDGGEIWVTWLGKGTDERLLYVQHVGDVLDTPVACH
jgi:hypothetical protein